MKRSAPAHETLSGREVDVLARFGRGGNKEAPRSLAISEATVTTALECGIIRLEG